MHQQPVLGYSLRLNVTLRYKHNISLFLYLGYATLWDVWTFLRGKLVYGYFVIFIFLQNPVDEASLLFRSGKAAALLLFCAGFGFVCLQLWL